jgi:hypothetical protein
MPIKESEVIKGQKVKLTHPKPGYELGLFNPAVGTPWECEGALTGGKGTVITVKWDNGASNSYTLETLSLVSEFPGCVSIWEDM